MTPKKTNAARLLEERGLPYTLHSVTVDEDDLSAVAMAQLLGVSPDAVFKTLVTLGDRTGVIMACIPGDAELDLKAFAAASGNKSVTMVPLKEVFGLTGYVRGGCSPLAAKKPYPVFVDESAILHDFVFVSAGLRGHQLRLTPDALLAATGGTFAALCR